MSSFGDLESPSAYLATFSIIALALAHAGGVFGSMDLVPEGTAEQRIRAGRGDSGKEQQLLAFTSARARP
jgi:hypothetical protein